MGAATHTPNRVISAARVPSSKKSTATGMGDFYPPSGPAIHPEQAGGLRRGANLPRLHLAAWPSGLGKGLQSPLPGFDSRRRLHPSILRRSAGIDGVAPPFVT